MPGRALTPVRLDMSHTRMDLSSLLEIIRSCEGVGVLGGEERARVISWV